MQNFCKTWTHPHISELDEGNKLIMNIKHKETEDDILWHLKDTDSNKDSDTNSAIFRKSVSGFSFFWLNLCDLLRRIQFCF